MDKVMRVISKRAQKALSCYFKERLRDERRSRTVVVVRVVDLVRVELERGVVPVEDRGVHELAVAIRILSLPIRTITPKEGSYPAF